MLLFCAVFLFPDRPVLQEQQHAAGVPGLQDHPVPAVPGRRPQRPHVQADVCGATWRLSTGQHHRHHSEVRAA